MVPFSIEKRTWNKQDHIEASSESRGRLFAHRWLVFKPYGELGEVDSESEPAMFIGKVAGVLRPGKMRRNLPAFPPGQPQPSA